jgi:NAD-dependent dihydropyrimidine dehydrogenase PreA subunit
MKIDLEKCTGCSICEEVCPLDLTFVENRKVSIRDGCVDCGTCMRFCPEGVFSAAEAGDKPTCAACPVMCRIPEGGYGACMRYCNEKGEIIRQTRVHAYEEVEAIVGATDDRITGRPLLTGIGAGTTYPDFRPSPFIVSGVRDGIDIITVVTEAPLSYSSVKVKMDTDLYAGEEGRRIYVRRKGRRHVGHLCTEEYGSKMLTLGGVNIFTSKDGLFAARVMARFLRGGKITIEVEEGAVIELSLGRAPRVNGVSEDRMRVGCGSATTGLFATYMYEAADEVIVLDGHITGLFSEHPSGKYLKKPRSPISIKGQKSTDGRYFLGKGSGWGGTDIRQPLDVIQKIDRKRCTEGMTLLITETTGRKYAFYRFKNGDLREEEPEPPAMRFLEVLRDSCEPSRVSAVFAGGVGGSARAGVTRNPIRLTKAVHEGRVAITIGGARPFIFPGGGINFLVDVERIKFGSIYLTPTPSFVLPVEYTMRRETFEEIGGHIASIRPVDEVLAKTKDQEPEKRPGE